MLQPRGGPFEIVLAAFFLLMIYVTYRLVRRRRRFARVAADVDLPNLQTAERVTGTLGRVYRDPAQGVWLAELRLGIRSLTFCATDHETQAERYRQSAGKETTVALFALSTLAPGGVEAMRDQIRDADRANLSPDTVTLIPTGQYANDHVVIGRVLDDRDDAWDEMLLTLYRAEVLREGGVTVTMELAVPRDPTQDRFKAGSLIHGSTRLFGYLV